jgi:hypothetical protein
MLNRAYKDHINWLSTQIVVYHAYIHNVCAVTKSSALIACPDLTYRLQICPDQQNLIQLKIQGNTSQHPIISRTMLFLVRNQKLKW